MYRPNHFPPDTCAECADYEYSAMMTPMRYGAPYPSATAPYPQTAPSYQMPPSGATIPSTGVTTPGTAPGEESYIENILRFNRGKIATFYTTYENNTQWNARVYRGRIETAGRDHIIISDPQTGKRYLLLMVNLDWVEFDEPIAYVPPAASSQILTSGEDLDR
jgi:spore germination protein Q